MDQNATTQHFSVWLQEMDVPPLGRDVMLASATKVPMLSAEWQALQNPDTFVDPEEGKFRWDGTFAPNPELAGSWAQVGSVAAIEDFQPGAPAKGKTPPLGDITFHMDGATQDEFLIWSGDMLMDLRKNEALKITAATIEGTAYLFIEAGGFSARNGPDWKPPLHVMKRK
jgi:hypothetical protein